MPMLGQAPINRRRVLTAGAFALLSGTALARGEAKPSEKEEAKLLDQARQILKALTPLHERKRPNETGDWLVSHAEAGQTFEQYVSGQGTRVAAKYQKLYVQPLGTFTKPQEEVLKRTGDVLAAFFGMKLEVLKGIALEAIPESAKRINEYTKEPQWLTTYLMQSVLKPKAPKDAAAVLGLTAVDLWPGMGWNFVFGQASLSERIGVWSMARNGDPSGDELERKLFLRRTLKTAAHETGHMLGILHCKLYECGMNGSNNRQESDRQPLEFCPECQAKIYWTCNAMPKKRLSELFDLMKTYELEEASSFEAELKAIKEM
jgi:archaemetzincin